MSMTDASEGLKAAGTFAGQITNISVGLLAFTVAFAKEFKPSGQSDIALTWELIACWGALSLTLLLSLWVQMAVVGSLAKLESAGGGLSANAFNVRFPGALMILTLLGSMGLMIAAGVASFG